MARTRYSDASEQRRREAVILLRQGVTPSLRATSAGHTRQSVSRWQAMLRRSTRAGRPPTLTTADLKRVERALKAGPEVQGYATGLWNLPRVAKLVERECGVRFGKTRVWQLLRALGWAGRPQATPARERDEAAIRRWKRVERSGHDQESADRGLPASPARTTSPQAAHHLGWA